MVFSSVLFVFLFLPIVGLIYYFTKEEYRNYILLLSSIVFYSMGEPFFVFIMIASIVVNYLTAIWIDRATPNKRAIVLMFDIVFNIGLLFVYKYLDFFINTINKISGTQIALFKIALPIGISFFTFQAMSYVIDVYRKDVNVQKNIFYVALYIAFFPQLIAGPIVRYSDIEKQIVNRNHSFSQYGEGMRRFILGFAKKVILANNLSNITQMVFVGDVDSLSRNGYILWLGAICFSLQIFFDFSGYSDMAIGLGKMFGFEFRENFNYPYIAKTITDFWRRWHISLSSWFRDYVYIPLGGSRVGIFRHIFNLLVVWSLTGLWHGANLTFIAWGIIYFVLLVLEKYLINPEKYSNFLFVSIYRVFVLIVVNFAWVIFNSPDVTYGIRYCARMIGLGADIDWNWKSELSKLTNQYGFFIIMGIVLSTPVMNKISKLFVKEGCVAKLCFFIRQAAYVFIFLWAVSFLVLGAHNPFIYFNF